MKKDISKLDLIQDKQLKMQANEQVIKFAMEAKQDPHRLNYHVMPPVGLLNDPNGFIYFKGEYHLFFQWNPFATDHSKKFWAHITSLDLVNWEWQPIALAPSDWFDKNGCYSGSAIEHEGEMYLFYTGNVRDEHGERKSYQCLATSKDGIHFVKKGPLFTVPLGYTEHFRDPKVWREGNDWFMVIGAQTQALQGRTLLYRSVNLEDWELVGEVMDQEPNALHNFGYMWECPDLFNFDGKDVLLFSPQGIAAKGFHYQNIYQTGYLVGELDRDNAVFHHQDFVELDCGFDFYAPQTTMDGKGRRLLFGWMGLPEENEEYHPTKAYGWIHAMTLPRELSLREGHLYQQPVEELKELRVDEVVDDRITIVNKQQYVIKGNALAAEIILDLDSFNGESLTLDLDGHTKLIYKQEKGTLTLFRDNIKTNKQESRTVELTILNDLQIFIDNSSIEVFVNQGAHVFTSRLFDVLDERVCYLEVDGELNCSIKKWNLKKVIY